MRFRKWLEWGSVHDIRGEYWIIDGYVDFADGDVGDRNHEMIATDHIIGQYADDVSNLAEELGLDHEVENYGEVDYEGFESALQGIREKLEDTMSEEEADAHIMSELNCDQETYTTILGFGDPRLYAMKRLGWIAVRSNNVELFGYDVKRQKEIAEAIYEILSQEHGGEQEPDPSKVEVSVVDHRSGKDWYTTLQELEQQQVAPKMSVPITTTTNKPIPMGPDSEENKYTDPAKSKVDPWNAAWRKGGFGSEIWRGTSESHFRASSIS